MLKQELEGELELARLRNQLADTSRAHAHKDESEKTTHHLKLMREKKSFNEKASSIPTMPPAIVSQHQQIQMQMQMQQQ